MKKIIAILLFCTVFIGSYLCVSADSQSSEPFLKEELIAIGQKGEKLYAVSEDRNSEFIRSGSTPIYNDGSVIPYSPLIQEWLYPAAERIDTIEKCKEEFDACFTDNFYIAKRHLFENTVFLINEEVYIQQSADVCRNGRFVPLWNTAYVDCTTADTAVLKLNSYCALLNEIRNDTIEYQLTADGYRICGGSYFTEAYGYTDLEILSELPPNTGENTGIFLVWAVVTFVALYTVVMGIRKKKTANGSY